MDVVDEAKNKQKAKISSPAAKPVPTAWQVKVQFSDILDDHISRLSNRNEQLISATRLAIKAFAKLKINKLSELQRNNEVVIPAKLDLGTDDKGRFTAPWLAGFEHYHLKLQDARRGDISIIYKYGFDQDNKILNLYLAAIGNHDDNKNRKFGNACQNAEYPNFDLLPVLERYLSEQKSID